MLRFLVWLLRQIMVAFLCERRGNKFTFGLADFEVFGEYPDEAFSKQKSLKADRKI